MKYAFVLAAVGVATAQNLAGVPTCAQPCLVSGIAASGCGASDVACQCQPANQAAVANAALPCLLSNCQATDLPVAQSAGAALCSAFSAGNTGGPVATPTPSSSTGAPTFQTTPPASTTGGPATNGTSGGGSGGAGGNGTVVTPPKPTTDAPKPGAAAVSSPMMAGVAAVAGFLAIAVAL